MALFDARGDDGNGSAPADETDNEIPHQSA